MHLRKINVGLLIESAIAYRIFITTSETLFLRVLTGSWKLAVAGSIIWNVINVLLYFVYHYSFARLFKLGEEK